MRWTATSVYKDMHKLAFRLGDDGPTQMRGVVRLAERRYPNFKQMGGVGARLCWGHDCLADFQAGHGQFQAERRGGKAL